jgi:hypothetical protein
MNGAAAVGTSTNYAREDHRHPTDTTLAPLTSPHFTGDPTAPTPADGDNDTSIATTAFVNKAVAAGSAPVAATYQEFLANSAPTKMLTPGPFWNAANSYVVTDATTVQINLALGINFYWVINAVRTLGNVINGKDGQQGYLIIRQGPGGNNYINGWGSQWLFPGGVKPPAISSTPYAIDVWQYYYMSGNGMLVTNVLQGFA